MLTRYENEKRRRNVSCDRRLYSGDHKYIHVLYADLLKLT
jgi:hypothetical protein